MLVISFYCYAIWLVILLPAVLPTALVVVDGVLWPRARHGHCLLAWHLRYKCVCVCVFVVRIHWSAFVWRSSAPHVDACGIIKTFPHITTAHYTKAKTKKHKQNSASKWHNNNISGKKTKEWRTCTRGFLNARKCAEQQQQHSECVAAERCILLTFIRI